MKKKNYKTLEIEVICFERSDVITSSGEYDGGIDGGEYED